MRNLLFLLLTVFSFSTTAFAQTTETDADQDLDYYNQRPERVFDDRGGAWWFGTGAQLGFVGGNNTSFFNIGLTPIAGYKLNNFLSVGPRGSILYNRYSQDANGTQGPVKLSYFTYSAGAFARALVFRGIFAHAEYSLVNEVDNFDSAGDPIRRTRAIPFLGAGLQQGGGPGQVGFEILLLFRLTQADVIGDSPYEFRTGINYNF